MSQNLILDWLKRDEELCNIVNKIDATGNSFEEQAFDAFHLLCEHYDLPKYPEDFTDKYYTRFEKMGIDDPRSVYEEATIFNYLEPNEDPRGKVMVAIYNVKNGKFIDINECALKHFGSKESIPKEYSVCFIGEGFAGRLHFLKPEESWFDLGAKSANRVINR